MTLFLTAGIIAALLAVWSWIAGSETAFLGWTALLNWIVGFQLLGVHAAISVLFLAFAVLLTWMWWNRWRDKRRRALQLLGEKSRAALARLLDKMRERGTPVPC